MFPPLQLLLPKLKVTSWRFKCFALIAIGINLYIVNNVFFSDLIVFTATAHFSLGVLFNLIIFFIIKSFSDNYLNIK